MRLATSMPGTALDEPFSLQGDAPQHWSREEWFYMWTKGLDPRRIAALCRVPYRKVYDHIRTRIRHKPELFGQRLVLHDQPALPFGGLKRRAPWDKRYVELRDFVHEHGRFPRGYIEDESSLYSFLQYQRQQYRAGKLLETRKSQLDERVPGWLTRPKAERERDLWERRLTELTEFLRDHNGGFPQYESAAGASEKTLAVWIRWQRRCLRRGVMDQDRALRLNERIPGWDKPRFIP